MLPKDQAQNILDEADLIFPEHEVQSAVARVASEISARLGDEHPLIISVMGGAVVFTGHLLTHLKFPLDFDYIHVSRYGNATQGGELQWKVLPRENVTGRNVLVVDDILDEGHTLAAIRDKVLELGAKRFYSAVFADKQIGRQKPVRADFVGIEVPDRYVFGFGMDVKGAWRNLPAIYAVKGL